jgi:exosortase
MARRHVAAALLLCAGVVWLYGSALSSLVQQWASDDDYSHGFFVLPMAAFFVWERRDALRRAPFRPSIWGLVLLAASLTMFLAGIFGAELFLTRISLIGVLTGAILFVWGRDQFRILLLPLAFLLLMIPLPAIIFNQLAFPLQLLASRVGESAIAGAGIPVLREGNVLHLANINLEVAEACSGIRSLVSLLMLAIVLGYFTEPRIGGRVALALAAIPIAIVANAARVAGTGVLSHWMGREAAEGFFHSFSGWLMFIVAFAGLLAVQRLIARVRPGHVGATAVSVEA